MRLLAALQAQTSCQLPYPERFSEAAKFVAERECSTTSGLGAHAAADEGQERMGAACRRRRARQRYSAAACALPT